MPPRDMTEEEASKRRHSDSRPTLPPIRDLFASELSESPTPTATSLHPSHSPSLGFRSLHINDSGSAATRESYGYPSASSRRPETQFAGHFNPDRGAQSSSESMPSMSSTSRPSSHSFSSPSSRRPSGPGDRHSAPSISSMSSAYSPRYSHRHSTSESSATLTDEVDWEMGRHWSSSAPNALQFHPYVRGSAAHPAVDYYATERPVPILPSPHGSGPEVVGADKTYSSARYECSYCHKGFNRPSSLKIHINSHTGEKPFQCPHEGCGRCFSVLSNMRRHARGHNQPSRDQQRESSSEEAEGTDDCQSLSGSPSLSTRIPAPPSSGSLSHNISSRRPHNSSVSGGSARGN